MSEPLTEDDIADILKIIKNAEPKWFDLGIHLGIKSAQLKQFEQTNRAMTEVILYWIENSHEPTWSVLAIALENIDCKSSASSIRSMYTGVVDADEEFKKVLKRIEEKKNEIAKQHHTAHQMVRKFHSGVQSSLDTRCQALKQRLQKHRREDQQIVNRLEIELNTKIEVCKEQQQKLKQLLSEPNFDMNTIKAIKETKHTLSEIKDSLEDIQQEIDDFALSKKSNNLLANAEINDVELLVDELMSHLKFEEYFSPSTVSMSSDTFSFDNISLPSLHSALPTQPDDNEEET